MIFWMIKLLKSVKTAIAGRKYPHQLAGAVAFGALLGIVPHGNLLAVAILLVVLSLRVNHAMAGLTAIGVSFAATRLDPLSHEVGQYVLSDPRWSETASRAWQMPLVPWTDLNNTIVMGSFVIGVAAILPIFMLTLPVFKLFASSPKEEQAAEEKETRRRTRNVAKHSIVLVDQGTQEISAPHTPAYVPAARVAPADQAEQNNEAEQIGGTEQIDETVQIESADTTESVAITTQRIDQPQTLAIASDLNEEVEATQEEHVSVETRIDVIRMKDYLQDSKPEAKAPASKPVEANVSEPPTDEALNYLLRQLRDSQQQRKAG